jgi:SulP family sulfate permease
LRDLRTHPKSSSVVMLGTVVVTVWTHDLAKGVFAGVLLSALFFARKVGRMLQVQEIDRDDGVRVYAVRGQVFFASAAQFAASFDVLRTPPKVLLDLTHAHFWDISAVAALDRVVFKLRAHGATVDIVGLNQASDTLIERLGTHRRAGARLRVGH